MAVRRPVVFASVLLSLALSVSACASDPPPAAAPPSGTAAPVASSTPASPTTTSASPATTTAPVDPVIAKIPKAARANDQDGAGAFAKFFMERVAESFVRADPTLIDGLYAKGCETCAAFRSTAAEFKKRGQHQAKPSFRIDETSIIRFLDSESVRVVTVYLTQVEVDIVDATGAPVSKTVAGKADFTLSMRWDERWIITLAG
jgi:hypothetical protein